MLTRFLDFDALTGIQTLFHYNELTDETTLEYKQDVEANLESAKKLHTAAWDRRTSRKSDYEHYAHIPNVIIEKWRIEKGVDVFNKHHVKEVWALVNSPDYANLKIATFYHQPK